MKKFLTLVAVLSMLVIPVVSAEEKEITSDYIENVVSTFDETGGDISFTLKQDFNLEDEDVFMVDVDLLQQSSPNGVAMATRKTDYEYTIYRDGKKVDSTKSLKAGDKISISGIMVLGDTSNTWQKERSTTAVISVMKENHAGEQLTLTFGENGITAKYTEMNNSIIQDVAYRYMLEKYADKQFIGGAGGMNGPVVYTFSEKLTENASIERSVALNTTDKTLKELKTEIDLQMNSNIVSIFLHDKSQKVGSDILKAIQAKKYIASITKYSEDGIYTWKFDGNKMTSSDFDIDLALNIGSSKHQEIMSNLIPDDRENPLYLEFNYHGTLPEGTSVSIVVRDQYSDGDYLTLYYYDESAKELKEVAKDLVVTKGTVNFTLEHCSEYVLIKQKTVIEDSKEEITKPDTSEKEEVAEPNTSEKEEVTEPDTSEEVNESKNDENVVNTAPSNAQTSSMNIVLYIVLAIASLIGIIMIVISNKKKIA